jgi:hypothetical protein
MHKLAEAKKHKKLMDYCKIHPEDPRCKGVQFSVGELIGQSGGGGGASQMSPERGEPRPPAAEERPIEESSIMPPPATESKKEEPEKEAKDEDPKDDIPPEEPPAPPARPAPEPPAPAPAVTTDLGGGEADAPITGSGGLPPITRARIGLRSALPHETPIGGSGGIVEMNPTTRYNPATGVSTSQDARLFMPGGRSAGTPFRQIPGHEMPSGIRQQGGGEWSGAARPDVGIEVGARGGGIGIRMGEPGGTEMVDISGEPAGLAPRSQLPASRSFGVARPSEPSPSSTFLRGRPAPPAPEPSHFSIEAGDAATERTASTVDMGTVGRALRPVPRGEYGASVGRAGGSARYLGGNARLRRGYTGEAPTSQSEMASMSQPMPSTTYSDPGLMATSAPAQAMPEEAAVDADALAGGGEAAAVEGLPEELALL